LKVQEGSELLRSDERVDASRLPATCAHTPHWNDAGSHSMRNAGSKALSLPQVVKAMKYPCIVNRACRAIHGEHKGQKAFESVVPLAMERIAQGHVACDKQCAARDLTQPPARYERPRYWIGLSAAVLLQPALSVKAVGRESGNFDASQHDIGCIEKPMLGRSDRRSCLRFLSFGRRCP
jgi:hypothetical protein